jgi:MFS family permease
VTADEATPGDGRRRFGGLLRQRNFRLFWIGETVNQLGSAMAVIGAPLLAVLFLHANTFEVGVLAAAAYLPWLVIGLPAGAWVDRLPPRPLMIACDVASAVLYASVPVAWAFGALTIGQFCTPSSCWRAQPLSCSARPIRSTCRRSSRPGNLPRATPSCRPAHQRLR